MQNGAEKCMIEWLAFKDLIDPAQLVKIKLHALRVEQLYLTRECRRRITLDTVYVDPQRGVRAVEDDAPHRLYLGSGVYGVIMLHWEPAAGFVASPWTDSSLREPGI